MTAPNTTPDPATLDRSRLFVGGFHESELSARAFVVPGLPPGCEAKTLSRDPMGASTQLVRIPAGWRSGRGGFTEATEVFVVSGRLQLDGRPLRPMTHVALPPGATSRYSAPIDTVVLVHAMGPLSFGEGSADGRIRCGGHRGTGLGAGARSWAPRRADGEAVHDADGGGPSLWLMAGVHWGKRAIWQRHQVSEEGFLLEGEMAAAVASGRRGEGPSLPGRRVFLPAATDTAPGAHRRFDVVVDAVVGPSDHRMERGPFPDRSDQG